MNTGHEGSLSTCHANGPDDALRRLETMVLLADVGLSLLAVREQLTSAVDLVVHDRSPAGRPSGRVGGGRGARARLARSAPGPSRPVPAPGPLADASTAWSRCPSGRRVRSARPRPIPGGWRHDRGQRSASSSCSPRALAAATSRESDAAPRRFATGSNRSGTRPAVPAGSPVGSCGAGTRAGVRVATRRRGGAPPLVGRRW